MPEEQKTSFVQRYCQSGKSRNESCKGPKYYIEQKRPWKEYYYSVGDRPFEMNEAPIDRFERKILESYAMMWGVVGEMARYGLPVSIAITAYLLLDLKVAADTGSSLTDKLTYEIGSEINALNEMYEKLFDEERAEIYREK